MYFHSILHSIFISKITSASQEMPVEACGDNNRKYFSLEVFGREKEKDRCLGVNIEEGRIREITCSREGNRMDLQKDLTYT